MGFQDSVRSFFVGLKAKVTGGKVVRCPHCGAENCAESLGQSSIPGVVVTEVVEVHCSKCGRMFIASSRK